MHADIALGRTGTNKPRDFQRLARAALEWERREAMHWAEASTVRAVSGRRCEAVAKRRERGSGGGDSLRNPDDSLENRPVLQRISAGRREHASVFIKHTVFGDGLNRSRGIIARRGDTRGRRR